MTDSCPPCPAELRDDHDGGQQSVDDRERDPAEDRRGEGQVRHRVSDHLGAGQDVPEKSPDEVIELFTPLVPAFANLGNLAKIWLAETDAGRYGALYLWRNREDMDAFMASDLHADNEVHRDRALSAVLHPMLGPASRAGSQSVGM